MHRVGGNTCHGHGQGYASAGSRYSESAVAVEGGCYPDMGGGWSYYGGGPASRATGGGNGVLGASHDGGGGGSYGGYWSDRGHVSGDAGEQIAVGYRRV